MMGGGMGTNNHGELLGMWMVLFFTRRQNIKNMEIFGNSKILIYWAKGIGGLHSITREG